MTFEGFFRVVAKVNGVSEIQSKEKDNVGDPRYSFFYESAQERRKDVYPAILCSERNPE